jgi:pantoate--beta-alanine ligase
MRILSDPAEISDLSRHWRVGKRTVGFVPTMGALHEGHLSLVRRSRRENALTVVSIYVNPLQFGPQEDLKSYPRDLEADARLLKKEKVDVLFTPSDEVMYPQGFSTKLKVTGDLVKGLCAPFRPGHFDGVATVVVKLLNLVRPHTLYLGQKDAQQAAVLKRVVQDLDMDVSVCAAPIVRESDGLAMSSRNVRLLSEGRRAAPVLFRALKVGRGMVDLGETDAGKVLAEVRRILGEEKRVKLQYLELVHRDTLEPMESITPEGMLAVAAHIDGVRLIDNMLLSDKLISPV